MNTNWKKQFFIIYAGQAFSLLGSAAVQFAVIWWLTVQTESAITLSMASIVAFLPNILIGPFAGVFIDRYNRRTIMMIADGLVALSSAVLAIAFLAPEAPSLLFVYFILFLRGLGNTFHGPAMQAAIPMLVPPEMLTKAGGWGNLITSLTNMVGPVLGAAMMTFLPISGIMVVDILGAAFAVICLLFVTIPSVPRSEGKVEMLADMKQGFAAMRANRPFMAAFLPMVVATVLYMPMGALFPLLVRTHFMGEAWHNGVVEFVFAGGLLVSSVIVGIWGGMRKRFLMVSLSVAALGVACLVGGALPPGGYRAFVICCFVMGASGTFMSVPYTAYMQESFAPEVLGKVFSLWMAILSFAMPIGLLVAGPVSEAIGVDTWFFWSGVGMVLAALLFRLRTKPYDEVTMMRTPEKEG